MSGIATAIVGSAVVGAAASSSASKRAAKAQQGASDAAALQAQIAQDQWDKYNEIYTPLEKNFVSEAQNYDTPENYARAAGDASATVSEQFGKARDRLARTPGMDPSQAGYSANLMGLNLAQAATDATQQNAARQKVKDTAFARKTDALSLGKGLPAQASASLANAGNAMSNIGAQQSALAGQQATAVGQLFSPGNIMSAGKAVGNWLGDAPTSAPQTSTSNFNYATDTPKDLAGTSYI